MFVIHGEANRHMPIKMGQPIFEATGPDNKSFVSVGGHGHSALWTGEGQDRLFGFLGRNFPP